MREMALDPYEILGVAKDASQDEIKRKYREIAKKNHPDLNPGDAGAEARFKEASQAYDILGDAEKRGKFDRGEIDASGQARPEQQFYRQYAEADPSGKYHRYESFSDMGDLGGVFDDLFGGRRQRGGAAGAGGEFRMRGGDVRYQMTVDFMEAANGARRRVAMPDGRSLDIAIPKGLKDGQTLRLKGQGQPGIGGGPAGDALVTISVEPHKFFERRGDDIHVTLPVTLHEAVLGAKVKVPTIGGAVALTIPENANTGDVLRLKGRGVAPASGPAGDQYVTLKLVLPEQPEEKLKTFLRDNPGQAYHPRKDMGV
jgi:DnaJ-class molecular chaperone